MAPPLGVLLPCIITKCRGKDGSGASESLLRPLLYIKRLLVFALVFPPPQTAFFWGCPSSPPPSIHILAVIDAAGRPEERMPSRAVRMVAVCGKQRGRGTLDPPQGVVGFGVSLGPPSAKGVAGGPSRIGRGSDQTQSPGPLYPKGEGEVPYGLATPLRGIEKQTVHLVFFLNYFFLLSLAIYPLPAGVVLLPLYSPTSSPHFLLLSISPNFTEPTSLEPVSGFW